MRALVTLFFLTAAPMPFDDLLKPAWKAMPTETKPTVFWDYRVAPPLPSEWPMAPRSTLVRWVYGAGRDVNLSDGERIAAPWARLDVGADGALTLTTLSKRLDVIGTQGVRPVSKDDAETVRRVHQADDALRKNDLAQVRAGYCLWRSWNGAIAGHLEAKHAAFFAALDCPKR
jgi:hypothetical protein